MNAKIFHFHLFKNAGTSVDAILEHNFGSKWKEREFECPFSLIPAEVQSWVESSPECVAFSSHTAVGPLPIIENHSVIPILFIRHPMDRLRSAYNFERSQMANGYGSVVARETTLGGYIRIRLATSGERFARNFHASRLGQFARDFDGDDYTKAIAAMDTLGFVGIVDQFDQSMEIFASKIREHFPEFSPLEVWKNASHSRDLSLIKNLETMEEEVGISTWRDLMDANAIDLEIYREANRRLQSLI